MTIEKAIDNWLLTFLAAELGEESDYETLRLDEIREASLTAPADWMDWKEDWTLPALGFTSVLAQRRSAGHGSPMGKQRRYRAIPYVLTFVVLTDDKSAARDDLNELFDRAESLFFATTTLTSAAVAIQTNSPGKLAKLLCMTSDDPAATAAERGAGSSLIRYYRHTAEGNKVWGRGIYNVVFLVTTGA